jgi:alpha-D-xyloside xylohydrolase
VFELLEKVRGENEAVLFARSATAGGQKFPAHWGGDCYSNYVSMAESLRGGLSLTMSGFGYWSHDIGGFENTSTPDVYKRWCAFGLLSSHSRLHGSSSYRVPWVYDDEAVSVLARFVRLKARLMPYIFSLAVENSHSGLPLMRAMVMEFPKDPACAYLDRQYMFGPSLLVAPIFNAKGIGEYYLPLPGQIWTHLLTGETREGGRWYKETYDYMSLPLFVRPSSIVATGEGHLPEYDYIDCITLAIYGAEEPDFTAETAVYSAGYADSAALSVKAERIEDHIFVNVQTDKACRIVLVGLRGVSCAQDDVTVDDTNSDTIIVLERGMNLDCRVKRE